MPVNSLQSVVIEYLLQAIFSTDIVPELGGTLLTYGTRIRQVPGSFEWDFFVVFLKLSRQKPGWIFFHDLPLPLFSSFRIISQILAYVTLRESKSLIEVAYIWRSQIYCTLCKALTTQTKAAVRSPGRKNLLVGETCLALGTAYVYLSCFS